MVRIEELKERLGREVYKLGRRYLIESIEQYVVKFQTPKYETTFNKLLLEVFTMEATWDWRTAIPKEEKEELFVLVRIADGRKEIAKNPEAYGNSNRELLWFICNVITHWTDHKFKTLDEVYEKINSWLPGLFQSWGTTEATIMGINSTTRNGFASDVLVDLKKQWEELKKKRDSYYFGVNCFMLESLMSCVSFSSFFCVFLLSFSGPGMRLQVSAIILYVVSFFVDCYSSFSKLNC